MDETFTPVVTSPAIAAGSNIDAVNLDSDGLTIYLTTPYPDVRACQICFPSPLAVQITDEGDRLRSMEYLDGRATTPLGQIGNSSWLKWFVDETLEIRKHDSLVHWCIVTPNDIIEVIAADTPDVRIFPVDT